MRSLRMLVVAATIIVLAACQSPASEHKRPSANRVPTPETRTDHRDLPANLSTMTPYAVPSVADPKPPKGFTLAFAESVGRHGSRSLTNDHSIDDAIELWDEAKRKDALTATGRKFGPDARALRDAMDDVGFGDLSTLGKEELQGLGVRAGKRLAPIFEHAVEQGTKVDIIDSGRDRAGESADNFAEGLALIHPDIEIEPTEDDDELLKFDNTNDAYEDFLDGDDWKPAYNAVRKNAGIDDAAVTMLDRLYKPSFVADVDNVLAAADGVYDVYRSAPAMSRDVKVDTRKLMDPQAAATFSYVEDAKYFYRRGPGVEGDDRTYKAAGVLLDDFFDVIDDRLEGRGPHPHAAVFRFAHGEEIIPFAALLELPGSDRQGKPDELYTHENNDFRVEDAAPLASNIEWAVWSKGATSLVSISKDEKPTTIGRGCRPYERDGLFYELNELKRCLHDLR